jgi:hypothetical protein
MSAAQILSGANATVSPLVTPGPGTNVLVSCRNTAATAGGLAVRADVQGAVMNIYEEASLAAAQVGAGVGGDLFGYRTTVSGSAPAGGILPGRKQWFTYKNGGFESEILRTGVPGGADQSLIYANVAPIATSRFGTFTVQGGGGVQVIPCPGATANTNSAVFSIAGTTNGGGLAAYAAALPVPTITAQAAGVSFTVTANAACAGLIYSYQLLN